MQWVKKMQTQWHRFEAWVQPVGWRGLEPVDAMLPGDIRHLVEGY